ncbi:MAG: hypothetical protein B6I20_02725 [Bacteroidetes bacterium 4572_117]|nr:MAG: hypothetical protein B6I20_02725 [Bacteroidetes bacterium 4572_117]
MGKIIVFMVVFLFCGISVSAQNAKEKRQQLDSIANYQNSTLFNSDEIINFDLKFNKKAVFNDVGDNRVYHWAKVKYENENGDSVKLKIKVKTRGIFRRDPQNCNFPQLKLKIPKKVRWDTNIFSGQSSIKLVVPCFKNKERYQELVMKEYLAYRIYNLLTDLSYKVRLVNINLTDSASNKKLFSFRGYFIEETKQMAKRINGITLKLTRFHQKNVDRKQMTNFAVFQYFIGNTDWSVSGLHNMKLLFINNSNVPIAVPYDFDWCGLVNSPYAFPSPKIKTKSVRIRVFRGYERELEEYEPVIKKFNSKKTAIYKLFENNQLLSEKTRKSTKKYFDEFYETINDPKQVRNKFVRAARR